MVSREPPVPPEPLVQPVQSAPQEHRGLREILARKVHKAYKVLRVLLVHRDHRES